jgi:4-amino-4-deoxy-L-arabinose transferase-like glycosyltransferase/membrane-associated phospholipid phosphatase
MRQPVKSLYTPYLLAAVMLLAAAVLIYPFDTALYQILRTFSHRVGKIHIVQELLNLVRPFGKGDVILLIIAALGMVGARRKAMHILLALGIVAILVTPLKNVVGRERPAFTNDESFPSGDAATAAAFCVPLLTASPWTAPLAAVITGGVITGRIYDGRHFPSDALTGAALGLVASAIALAILRRWRWRPPRRWFFIAGILIIAFAVINLSWARATPFVLNFLRVWGPLGVFLLIVRLLPAWQKKPMRSSILLFAIIFTLYLSLCNASSLWDRDEPRFSRATVEMVESGNYLVPTFNGQLRADKPILIYWLMSLPVRLLGPSELACRLVAPIATLITALLTVWIARRLTGPKPALTAGLILMMSPLMAVSGTAATTDALLLACITGAIATFLLSWFQGFKVWHVPLMILALAGAILTKGPVGLAVPLLVIAAIMIFAKRGALRPLPYLGWLVFAVAWATLIFFAWGLPANAATNGEFLRLGIGKHVVDRSLNAMESHGGHSFVFYFYYLPVILLAFFPWTLYLPRLFSRLTPVVTDVPPVPALEDSAETAATTVSYSTSARRSLLLCWGVPVILLMSLVATKLPHYILPAWPALAIATALGLQRAINEGPAGNRTLAARIGLGLFLLVGLFLGLGLICAPWFLPVFGVRVPATGVGMIFLTMVFLAWRQYRLAKHRLVAGILISGMMAVFLSAALILLPAIESYKVAPLIASLIQKQSSPDTPVTTCGYGEPSLNFYLGRKAPLISLEGPDLPAWAAAPGKGILVVTETRLDPVREALNTSRIQTLDIIPGFNYSQGKWVMIHILARDK